MPPVFRHSQVILMPARNFEILVVRGVNVFACSLLHETAFGGDQVFGKLMATHSSFAADGGWPVFLIVKELCRPKPRENKKARWCSGKN